MARYRTHLLDVYGAVLYLATDLDQWKSLRRRIDTLDEDPGGVGSASLEIFEADNGMNIPHLPVFVNVEAHGEDGAALVNTCAHEGTHVAAMLLDHIGQQGGNSEALAYLAAWVTEWLWEGCTA